MDQNTNNRDPDTSNTGSTLDPKRLSFSQAQDYECVPAPLKLEELPRNARTQIWNFLYFCLEQSKRDTGGMWVKIDISGNWEEILRNTHCFFDNLALDDWSPDFETNRKKLRQHIEQDPFNRVFDRLQFIMRDRNCPREFIRNLKRIFAICGLAYTIDPGPPPTILPAATLEEGEALMQSLQSLRKAGLGGSAAHLQEAAQRINSRDSAGAIRESIHAVESVARQIDPKASRTLGPALKSLKEHGKLHPALKDAFNKLYGYTSDEQGIRHALLEKTSARTGMNEAVFMLGACASFASYLWRKHVSGSGS